MAKVQHILRDLLLHPIKTLRSFKRSLVKTSFVSKLITSQFHQLYYDSEKRTWGNTTWLGVKVLKCPLDLWIYQEILFRVKPDVIVECGTASGGSAFYFAGIMDLLGKGRIVTIDVQEHPRPKHERITYLLGFSTDPAIFAKVQSLIAPGETVLVVLDSDHSKANVLNELNLYGPLVSLGSYMCVEDSNQNGHPVSPYSGPGPMEAIREYLPRNRQFEADKACEKFYLSFNPSGYLRRVS